MQKQKKYTFCLRTAAAALIAACLLLSGCGESKEAKEARLQGIEQLETGQLEAAVVSFETALEHADGIVDEFELDILKYRGEAEYRLGDYEAAAHTYGILADVDDGKPEYLEYQARAGVQAVNREGIRLLEEGSAEEALNAFEEGLALLQEKKLEDTTLEALLYYNIGAAYEAQGDFAKALEHFRGYVSSYGVTPELEKEIAFLESRLTEE